MYNGDLAYPYRQGISTLDSCCSYESCRGMDHVNENCDHSAWTSHQILLCLDIKETPEARAYTDIGITPRAPVDHSQNFVESAD